MRVVVLGATGRVGRRVVARALAEGEDVVAYVRNPSGLKAQPRLTVIAGELTDEASLRAAFAHADVVISCIGAGVQRKGPVTLLQDTLPVVMRAATSAGVERFVLLTSLGVGDTARKASLLPRIVYRTAMRSVFQDKALAEADLPAASSVHWTAVHAVSLKDAPETKATVLTAETVTHIPGVPSLSFDSVATTLLALARSDAYSHQHVLLVDSALVPRLRFAHSGR